MDEPVDSETGGLPAPRSAYQGAETVLVAEDQEAVRTIVCNMLRRQGYYVLSAPSGDEALELAAGLKGPIHLLISDMVMPGISGRELADQLRSLRTDLKVLFMSGYTDSGIVHEQELEPGTAFIQKPFTIEQLAAKVREVLDSEPGAILVAGKASEDPAATRNPDS